MKPTATTTITCKKSFYKILILLLPFINAIRASNLTCYQCLRNIDTECSPEDLLPCPPISDRCVTHISKEAEGGLTVKRECGLGPCGFDDAMVNKGLGLSEKCDRSRNEYSCIICCQENGCNKSTAAANTVSRTMVLFLLVVGAAAATTLCTPGHVLEHFR